VSEIGPDALSYLVAAALSARAHKLRVFHWVGDMHDIRINIYQGMKAPWFKGLRLDPIRPLLIHETPRAVM
jgi:hypothetical protein